MLIRFKVSLSIVTLMLGLTACGGGGGGDTPVVTPPVDTPPTPGPGQVATAEGTYQGETLGSLLVFKGIPYAAPPTGALRFKAPEPPASFTGVRNALDFGSVCAQPQGASTVGNEDCLFLNIWGHDDDIVRPVMVYMHPGASNGVGGNLGSINPEELANDADVVVVNLNRRIGVLGYLAIDELIAENPRMTAGNYALLDAVEALKWVQDNIDEFNGDPNHVMLFGTSSGGILSCIMLGAPEVAGLVQAVAIQSAPCGGRPLQVLNAASPHTSSNPPVTDTHRSILPATGCDVAADILACLRGLSAEEIILASLDAELAVPHALYGQIVDGVVVVHPPRTALANQTIGDVAFIVGMASNEIGSRFNNLSIPDDATYQTVLSNIFVSPFDNALYTLYPSANYPTPKDAFLEAFSDLVFSCNGESLALNAMDGTPSYLYEITRGFDSGSQAGNSAYHAIDLPYLFGTFDAYGYTPDAQALVISDAMRTAWRSLAADPTAVPAISTDGSTLWPAFDPATASYVEFGDTVAGSTNHRGGRCAALRDALFAP
jgi:para-nitrobenzyl esterase